MPSVDSNHQSRLEVLAMTEILSLWRSPLDKVGVCAAETLVDRQPRCQISYNEDFSQMTIFNYAYYVSAAMNNDPDVALDAMLNAMKSNYYGNYGGVAFIPQQAYPTNQAYPVKAPVGGHTVWSQCNMIASGTGGTTTGAPPPAFFHFTITPQGGALNPSTFLSCSGNHTSGGQYFKGLSFQWGATTNTADTCILANTWNCRALECNFLNCPVAFDAAGLSCGLDRCTIQYNSGPNGSGFSGFAAVRLRGSQCFAIGPGEFLQLSQLSGGPTNTCCISFESGLEHGVVRDLHISHWSYGITYAISSNNEIKYCDIANVEFSTYTTCIYMAPSTTNGKIYGQKYTSCTFSRDFSSINRGALVYIDAAGGGVNDVQFIACTAFQGQGSGYELHSGSNIQIIGGTSAGNGTTGGAGIAITGTCSPCTVIGVNLDATYPAASGQAQQWAFLCSGSPAYPVLLDNCSMHGYGSPGPVSVAGSPTDLRITNCPGYNDQNTTIAPTPPLNTDVSASNASTITGGINYYGPSLVIFTNSTSMLTVKINSVTPGWIVPANAFVTIYLASPYDTINFGHAVAAFSWIGQ
jgi:hypothetical protein